MEKFDQNRTGQNPDTPETDVENVVDLAIERMKSGAVVKEERTKRFKFVLISALIIAGLAAFSTLDFIYQTPDSETTANGEITITLKQGQSGHYLATGKINDEAVRFIIDTGATDVAIPLKVAQKLGLPLGEKLTTLTANGYGTSYRTKIDSIELGDIKLVGVGATVSEGLPGDEALLGMSFLRRTRVETEKGIMKIIY